MTRHIIHQSATILQALRRLNDLSGDVMTLIVTDGDNTMLGTVTDGDIRRGMLNGADLTDTVESVLHRRFRHLSADADPAENVKTIRSARAAGIKLLPELSADKKVVRLIDLTTTRTLLPVTAVLMAGGKGERLRPLTLTTPKPLLEIGGRPIIDYNLENLARCGITDVWVTVKYLADQLREFFATPRHGISAKCVEEESPLGTIGSVSLVPLPASGTTLVMNSDLLTSIDLEEMFLHHHTQQADITIAAIPYTVSVPYAILSTDGSRVRSLEEKPTYSHFANAGIYMFSNAVLGALAPGERTDATDLIEAAIAEGLRVTYYPVSGTWIDIGSPADFRHAEELMKHHRSLNHID